MRPHEPADQIRAVGVTAPPPGMTAEEAERLVREADEREEETN